MAKTNGVAQLPDGRVQADLMGGQRSPVASILVYLFVIVPLGALTVAVPWAWGWGLSWLDVIQAGAWYTVTMLGVTVGFHRYFTHGSFKASRPMRVILAVAGSMAVQGPILQWVATHRRHHAFADRAGDPHSPWRFGTSPLALIRGAWHAHVGWLFSRDLTDQGRFAPDLVADQDMRVVHRLFGPLVLISLLAPSVIGGLITWSWSGALTGFFWASLVRLALQQHVTWSVNSICHLTGARPFAARDRSSNFWPLALLSFGDSWHNLHHAYPTCARHGVEPGQIDVSGRVIWILEKLGLAHDVRWPAPARLARLRKQAQLGKASMATGRVSPAKPGGGTWPAPEIMGRPITPMTTTRVGTRARLAEAVILRAARRLPFLVVRPGEFQPSGEPAACCRQAPMLRLHRPESFYRRLGSAGLIGFGEAYQAGDWDSDDLTALLKVFASNLDALIPSPLQRLRGHSAAPRPPREDEETIEGARRNVRRHYDLPSCLFQAFLDETMTYSSALFPTDASGDLIAREDMLADAQRRKIDRMLDLAEVRPGTRLLEIGTGWGELAIRAALRGAVVHSVTNSAEQAVLAQERAAKAGVAQQVHVDLRDFRQLTDSSGRFDAIISVEMIEAVGERYWPDYFSMLGRQLAPHGRVGLQAITMRHDRMMKARNTYTWIHKYIFPGGLIPSIPVIEQNLADYTDLHIKDCHTFGGHYAATLRLWRERFIRQWPTIAASGFDETFSRTWEFYLAYCEAGFASGLLNVYQMLLGR